MPASAAGALGQGALSGREQLAFTGEAVSALLRECARRAAARAGRRLGPAAAAVESEPPDTPLVGAAVALARAVYPPPLLEHCLRCWRWAALLAHGRGPAPDAELLVVACLLHDIGLTDTFRRGPDDPAECFAVHGGRVARERLVAAGADEGFAARAAEAIERHLDVRVPPAAGPEAHLLHAAAQLDVVGFGAGELGSAVVRRVLAAHPRDGFPACFRELLRRETRERPRSRAAVLRRLGLGVLAARNALDRAPLAGGTRR